MESVRTAKFPRELSFGANSRFVLLLLLLPLLSLATFKISQLSEETQAKADNYQSRLQGPKSLLSLMKDAEAGQRGYLSTGESSYLECYEHSLPLIREHLVNLEKLYANKLPQQELLAEFKSVLLAQLSSLAQTLAVNRQNRTAVPNQIGTTEIRSAYLLQLRVLMAEITDRDRKDLAVETQTAQAKTLALNRLIQFGLVCDLGVVLASAFAATNRSRKQRLEESFRRTTEAEFRTMAEATPSMIHSALPNGYQSYLSPLWIQRTGMSADQLLGYGWLDAVHPEDRQAVTDGWNSAVQNSKPFELVYRLLLRTGAYHWVLAREEPTIGVSGQLISWSGSVTDIDVQMESMQKLKVSQKNLEYFSHAASHDLQGPLHTINASVQLLLRQHQVDFSNEELELLGFISESSTHISALVCGLLKYALLDSREYSGAWEKVSMKAALSLALQHLQIAVREANAQIISDDLPEVSWLETPAVQVLQNLIANALKYHRPGVAPIVHVSVQTAGEEIRFLVRDNGAGIRQQQREHVFLPFTRVHKDAGVSGTGLGLSFCKRIVEQRGGRIWIESDENPGSTFIFSVPNAKLVDASNSEPGMKATAAAASRVEIACSSS